MAVETSDALVARVAVNGGLKHPLLANRTRPVVRFLFLLGANHSWRGFLLDLRF